MDHKKLAIDLFNETWDLIDKEQKTKEEEVSMIHKAHASLYHWLQVGKPIHFQRGEWMVSHVYALLGLGESALLHAKTCLQYTKDHQIEDFDLTFAYEAMARAYAVNKEEKAWEYLDMGYESLDQIKDEKDMAYAKSTLDEIKALIGEKEPYQNKYIYILRLCDRLHNDNDWTKKDNQIVAMHFQRLQKDYDLGKIVHVGRTLNPYDDGFGVVIYKAKNDEEAKQYMMEDPAVKENIMTASYHEYKIVFE